MTLSSPRFSTCFSPEDKPESFAGIEINGIARGLVVGDALVKKAKARIVLACPVTPGKFLILIDGDVANVDESLDEAIRIAGEHCIDRFKLPFAHETLEPAVFGYVRESRKGAIGIVETATVCSGIRSADIALKTADTNLAVIHPAVGIGGKCYYILVGDLYEVEASIGAAVDSASPHLLSTEIIPHPHPDFLNAIGLKKDVD